MAIQLDFLAHQGPVASILENGSAQGVILVQIACKLRSYRAISAKYVHII